MNNEDIIINNEDTITITLPSSISSDIILSSLPTVEYSWNNSAVGSVGFTAQEMEIDTSWIADWEETELWREIRKDAKENKTLQEALDRVKVLYYLSREDGKDI